MKALSIWCLLTLFTFTNSSYSNSKVPQSADEISGLAAGGFYTCALVNGKPNCWGLNVDHQLEIPKDIIGVTQLALGFRHGCALISEKVKCWGDSPYREAMNPPNDLIKPTELSAYGDYNCVSTSKGARCWGSTGFRKLVFDGLPDVKKVVVGDIQSCAILNSGKLICLGNDAVEGSNYEVPAGLDNISELVVGSSFVCVIADQKVNCWGDNQYGQSTPPTNLQKPSSLAASYNSVCAITARGVRCWGGNKEIVENIPKGMGHVAQLVAGALHMCALTDTGVKCWRDSTRGQLNVPKELIF